MQQSGRDEDVVTDQPPCDLRKAKKKQLLTMILPTLEENRRLRDTVARLSKLSTQPPVIRHPSHRDDYVPCGWAEQHGIDIPRADGLFESTTAWVRVAHGVITGAGLKNQSILSVMISMRLVDEREDVTARLYWDWKTAFLATVDPVKWNCDESHGAQEEWTKEDRYCKLLRRVDQDHLFAMDAIVAVKPKARHISAFNRHPHEFVGAFRTVADAIRDIEREARQAKENACA